MPAANQSLEELLVAISRCPEVSQVQSCKTHPCAAIVGTQDAASFQLPEPWRGHVDSAPILFISSNPSISGKRTFPPQEWPDSKVVAYYRDAFDENALDGAYQIDRKLGFQNTNKFWGAVRTRASEILGRYREQVTPGRDFAITNMVHCKSIGERGVRQALSLCSCRWLEPILKHSAAKVVVVLGKPAKEVLVRRYEKLDSERNFHSQIPLSDRERIVVFLPHPNARQKRKVRDHIAKEELQQLREFLQKPLNDGQSESGLEAQ